MAMVKYVLNKSPKVPRLNLPKTVGILGGSFDPPHQGHLQISHHLKTRLQLDEIWWFITSQNPLKAHKPQDNVKRIQACKTLISENGGKNTAICIYDETKMLGTYYTIDTVTKLQKIYPHTKFIWLMGADNFIHFHKWREWKKLMTLIPLAIYPRKGSNIRAGLSLTAKSFSTSRCDSNQPYLLKTQSAPSWCMFHSPLLPYASRELRAKY